jgi:hypothetical protein
MDKVKITCTRNNMSVPATLVQKSATNLKVHLPASDSVIFLEWDKTQYVGKSAGMEFISDGKVIKE